MINKTQAEIAEKLGVKQPTVSKYARGELKLSFNQGLALKKAFGCTDEEIQEFNSKKVKDETNNQ